MHRCSRTLRMVETTLVTGRAKHGADSKAGGWGGMERNCTVCSAEQRCFQPLSQRPSARRGQKESSRVQELLHLTPESRLQNSSWMGKDCTEFLWPGRFMPSICSALSLDHRCTLSLDPAHTRSPASAHTLSPDPAYILN